MTYLLKVFAHMFALSGSRLLEVKLLHARALSQLPFPLQHQGELVPYCGITRLETKSLHLCWVSHCPARNV